MFTTKIEEIIDQIENINPIRYGKTRNFLDGAVTRLSPYISRGVVSTRYVLERTLQKGYPFQQIEKFVHELAWRDYFQNVWSTNNLEKEIKQPQSGVENMQIPTAIITAATGIEAIDNGINTLYKTGYVHNHLRMYIASVTCNVGKKSLETPCPMVFLSFARCRLGEQCVQLAMDGGSFQQQKILRQPSKYQQALRHRPKRNFS